MYTLGIHFGHGAAAALVCDDRIIAAIEEEKLNRVKGYVGFPFFALEYVLSKANIAISDVDYLALGAENLAEFCYSFRHLNYNILQNGRQNVAGREMNFGRFLAGRKAIFLDKLKQKFTRWDNSEKLERLFIQFLTKELGISQEKVIKVNHHLAHAVSAFYCSPWDEAIVITADGKGDGLCGGIYRGQVDDISCLAEVSDRYSVGQFYQAVTKFLGYRPNRHEGKITGLAAYGEPNNTIKMLKSILDIDANGQFCNTFYNDETFTNYPVAFYENQVAEKDYIPASYIRALNGNLRHYSVVHQLYQNFLKEKLSQVEPKDIAAGIQQLAESLLTQFATHHLNDHLPCYVCLAGGVFANVKINQYISNIEGVKGIFVQPAMDDAGCALGAALYVQKKKSNSGPSGMDRVYLGPDYSDDEMENALKDRGLKYERASDPELEIAKMLADGKIVGRYNGALEWGPRALGNRSILVQSTDKTINDTLNQRLNRTEFMPFAPTMLSEYARDYLIGYKEQDFAARYMTVTYDIIPDKIPEIEAAVHIDGTARPQVLYKEDNPSYHKIISHYHSLTGIPVVVNTSFNMHEEPIVDTPSDAVRAYLSGAVDVLSLGPFLVYS